MSKNLKGYRGNAKKLLEKKNLKIWDILQIKTKKTEYQGILLPRNEYSDEKFIEIKLENNYNVGIHYNDISEIKKIGEKEAHYKIPEKKFPKSKDLPEITLLGTGGTVASRLDYTTGAVIPAFTPGELFSAVPELAEICNLETEILFKMLSENMKPDVWQTLAKKVETLAHSGKEGIIIAHGTDTMGYTSAALSFMLQNLSIPVVLVGSQRSSDRPSSDAAINLINAATVATSDIAEVVVVMLGSSSHEYGLIHKGTLVRKMHTSYRNTFRTIDDIPMGLVKSRTIRMLKENYRTKKSQSSKKTTKALTNFEDKIGMIYSYPGLTNEELNFYIDKGYKGIVIMGTGLGHVNTRVFDSIKRGIEEDILFIMTSQTLHGFIGMNVYSTGRELLDLGVIPAHNLIPETAYVKLGWVLGNSDSLQEAKQLFLTNIADEFLEREVPIAFNYDIEDLL
ncbi:MAG: Glutamyl-tRNA(Gln) amidotransferase subunit D [Promethearchaeota archaeon]|nr:MAG: Glutamyl-tRNA(Gln) amidotransferase subunit D [Candidatus Lokiarchaeota archaeon]